MTDEKIITPLTRDDLLVIVARSASLEDSNSPEISKMNDNFLKSIDKILQGQKLIKLIEERAEHPMAMNYLSFEAWIHDILRESEDFRK